MTIKSVACAVAVCAAAVFILVRQSPGVPASTDAPEVLAPAGGSGAPPATAAAAPASAADTLKTRAGRMVFVDKNCSLCHTAYALGVGEPPEGWTQAPSAGVDEGSSSSGPPDLSVLPATWTAERLKAYMVDRVEVEGAKHVTSFKGSDEEWTLLSWWMLSTRPDTSAAGPDGAAGAPAGESRGSVGAGDGSGSAAGEVGR